MNTVQRTDKKLDPENLALIMVDHFNAIESACVNAKLQIADLVGVKGLPTSSTATVSKTLPPASPPPMYKLDRISWEPAEGPHGPYERTREADATTNADLKLLLDDLRRREKFVVEGYFFWLMANFKIACRKRSIKK
jgi:hypothetical protein